MALEDFEQELAKQKDEKSRRKRDRSQERDRDRDGSGHHRRHHHSSKHQHHHRSRSEDRNKHHHHHKRSRHGDGDDGATKASSERDVTAAKPSDEDEEDEWVEKEVQQASVGGESPTHKQSEASTVKPQRDAWMEAPSAMDVDYVQQRKQQPPQSGHVRASQEDYEPQIHERELNHHLREDGHDHGIDGVLDVPTQHEVNYVFGDEGSSWRMTRLKVVYRQAEETKRSVEDIAIERYGDLRSFDEAREEEIELDRRQRYGKDYVGKVKPSGELYQERKIDHGIRHDHGREDESEDEFELAQGTVMKEKPSLTTTLPLDQTALNKLKAEMMRAKLKKASNAAQLETEYNVALASAANGRQNDVVVLNKMESRMLAGGRKGEVNAIENKRGKERGLVEENEDMSIEDMVRQEKRTRGQFGGEGRAFAERIAKDAKFDNDLDYLDENASKLAKHVQKSDINLRNTAIEDFQKMKRILDTCPLCHHEDTSTPPQAPIVSLATRVFLTLPTSPEITPYGLCASIVPIQHRLNLLECDDDEWEEIRNFMKSLSRFYYNQKPKLSVIFYENAAHEGRKRHASMEAIALPLKFGADAPAFFKEAILAADEEWTQHKKLIDTLAKATTGGLGKLAFRRSMVTNLPYFHVWFSLDGGLGHIVEDTRRWPKGDLFAREIIGGMLDVSAEIVKRQGRWRRPDPEMDKRVQTFRSGKGWTKFDWTSVLMDPQ